MIGKDALLEAFIPTEELPLPSGKGTVRVRGLTRWEAVETQAGITEDDTAASLTLEQRAVARGMVDPKLTEEEVKAWQQGAVAADVAAVARRISELSNLDPAAGKGPTSRSKTTRR